MKFPIITLLTISSLLFIQPTQSTLPNPGLIEHVCKLTPHYNLCCLTLKSHALARKIRSKHDGLAFAKITLGVIAAKTPAILATLRKVHEQCEEPEFKMALGGCISSYTKISLDILPKALGCVDKGDSDGVKQHVLAIANLSTSCQKKCMAFAGSTLSALADTDSGSGSTKTGSSSAGSAKTGSSSTGSINAGSSSAGSAKTGSSSAGSSKTGSAAGSINTGSGSSSAGSSKTGSGSASGSINTGSGSASAGSTGSAASATKPAVKAAAKAVEDSNVYVQNMCAITVSIVTKVSATKQTTLT